MQILLGQVHRPSFDRGCALTIGNFDGVHLGHKHILKRLRQEADARKIPAVALIFEPQPKEFFAEKLGFDKPPRLSPLRDKLRLLNETGCLDAVWVLRFNQTFANITADAFIQETLIDTLNTKYLLIGDDFRFGAKRQGDFELLSAQSAFETAKTPSFMVENIRASSTVIREALSAGNIESANQLLGHDYILSGKVKHGLKLGRTLNCPTANIALPNYDYPLSGVFVVEVWGSFGRRRGVASFGINPTVSTNKRQKLEVHLFDWDASLYGQRLSIHFVHKLRDEVKFDGLETLTRQIQLDMQAARSYTY